MKQVDNSPLHSASDEMDNDTQQAKAFKKNIINKLSMMREGIQPLLYDKVRPERNEYLQRANFLYALMLKIKDEYKSGDNPLDFVNSLEREYPLATKTINDVKNMPEMQSD
ncbi:hypothetical protein [Legionella maioricensis]|uniref:Uncharacterized protein n=1 Tax=Legionella maioricensis TaxID=2896528 RepID=A0A9X2CZG0_9GAMM|nr:hypothetical protein [Legionella maioricensis]MCL9683519.1 hypothetical protein [Legionella maioricensis]MCL9686818.1 hypothetical protein [Legionella maioricensis]